MGKADAGLIDALPKLRIIASFGVGYDGVNAAHAAARNVIVTNTPDVLNDDVSNLAVTLVLTCSPPVFFASGRDMPVPDAGRKRAIRHWRVPSGTARSVSWGLAGSARISPRKLEVFGCMIGYHGRAEQAGQAYQFYGDLVDMARDCDFLIAICPGGDATRGIVNKAVLEALGPEGTFINIARGSVHDEDALIEALESGKQGYAGLDVFEFRTENFPERPAQSRQLSPPAASSGLGDH